MMGQTKTAVVVGTCFMDIKGYASGKYLPLGRNAGSVLTVHGGVARNVAEDIANAGGGYVRLVTYVDDAPTGAQVVDHLKEKGVDTRFVIPRKDGMGIWLALFSSSGELVGSISKRAEMGDMADMIDDSWIKMFMDAESIVVEVDLPRPVLERVIYYAKEKLEKRIIGVVSNMTIALEKNAPLLRDLDILICNEGEASMLIGSEFADCTPPDVQERLMRHFYDQGDTMPETLIVTLGAAGAVYVSRYYGDSGFCPAENVSNIVDTAGAGDAFCAGVALAMSKYGDLDSALKIGTHMAAETIKTSKNTCPVMTLGSL